MSGFEIIDDFNSLQVGEPNLVVALEKKGRGRGLAGIIARPWTSRTFKLKGQVLEYYDGDVLKGMSLYFISIVYYFSPLLWVLLIN